MAPADLTHEIVIAVLFSASLVALCVALALTTRRDP